MNDNISRKYDQISKVMEWNGWMKDFFLKILLWKISYMEKKYLLMAEDKGLVPGNCVDQPRGERNSWAVSQGPEAWSCWWLLRLLLGWWDYTAQKDTDNSLQSIISTQCRAGGYKPFLTPPLSTSLSESICNVYLHTCSLNWSILQPYGSKSPWIQ